MIIKIVRAAAPALDRAFEQLHSSGHTGAANTTKVEFLDLSVRVTPAPADRDTVLPRVISEFEAAGWGWSTKFDPSMKDTHEFDTLDDRESITFRHPASLTRTGEERPARPNTFRIDIPAPDPSQPITAELVQALIDEAAAVVLDTFRQQALKEGGGQPDPALWTKPPHPRSLSDMVEEFRPRATCDERAGD